MIEDGPEEEESSGDDHWPSRPRMRTVLKKKVPVAITSLLLVEKCSLHDFGTHLFDLRS